MYQCNFNLYFLLWLRISTFYPLKFLCISFLEKSHYCLCSFFYYYWFFSYLYIEALYMLWKMTLFVNWMACIFFLYRTFYVAELPIFYWNAKRWGLCDTLQNEVISKAILLQLSNQVADNHGIVTQLDTQSGFITLMAYSKS